MTEWTKVPPTERGFYWAREWYGPGRPEIARLGCDDCWFITGFEQPYTDDNGCLRRMEFWPERIEPPPTSPARATDPAAP